MTRWLDFIVGVPLSFILSFFVRKRTPVKQPVSRMLIIKLAAAGDTILLIPVLRELLSPAAVIFLDDAARPDEKEAVRRWREAYGLKESNISCEKGCTVLTIAPRGQ
jgi:hypothetical protein